MLPKLDNLTVITSWTNGEKAVDHLLENSAGEKLIMKAYRPGYTATISENVDKSLEGIQW